MKQNNGFIKILMILLLVLITIAIVVFGYFILTDQKNRKIYENNFNQISQEPILEEPKDPNAPYGGEAITANNLFYVQLDDTAKVLYKGLVAHQEDMKSGTYTINFGYQFHEILSQEGGMEKLNQAFQSAWNAYRFDQMDVFYIDVSKIFLFTKKITMNGKTTYEVTLGPKEGASYLSASYENKEVVERAKSQIDLRVNELLSSTNGTDEEKMKRIHDWMVNEISYAEENNQNDNSYDIHGGLLEKNAVCEGYARTFKLLMDRLQIPCLLVAGTATNSNGQTESHAWNMVSLGETWYAIDVTWDDPIVVGGGMLGEERRYAYYLKGSEEFYQTHTPSGMLSENSMEFLYPELDKENYVR